MIGLFSRERNRRTDCAAMPSLMRLLVVVGTACALGYVILFALANFVVPKPREITVAVPPDRFVKQQR